MILDARTLEPGAVLEAEVAVVGGGLAGLLLARELSGADCRVCLLESGGSGREAEPQALAGLEPPDNDLGPRLEGWRQLGGTAHLWNTYVGRSQPAARFIPLDTVDFEERDWVPHSGWPLSRSDLHPYYERARRACGVRPEGSGSARPWGAGFTTTVEDFGLADVFTVEHPRNVMRSPNVTAVLHATAVDVRPDEGGASVGEVRAVARPGRVFSVRARLFVLAAGAIETTRLLLLSRLGNRYDLVGRYFMDHHRVNGGRLVPADPGLFDRAAIYDLRPVGGHYVMGKLTPTGDLMRRERLLNSSTLLRPQPGPRTDAAVEAAKRFASGLRRGRPDVGALGTALAGSPYLLGTGLRLARHQWRFPPDIGRGRWSLLPNNHRRFQSFELIHQCEQAPHPANRVTLGRERDHLGLPRATVTTRWSEIDVLSIARLHEVLDRYFGASGLGHVLRRQTDQPDLHNAGGMHHHLGTTRMHPDERRGVVDLDCRVHGMANLYVASGAVFPTGGYANPNLTIAALAIRLADHVKATLGATPTAVSR